MHSNDPDYGGGLSIEKSCPKALGYGFTQEEDEEEVTEEKSGSDSELGADPEPDVASVDGSVVEHTSSVTGSKGAPVAQSEGSVEAPPLAAPDLFDAVAEEWQRLRLAMQDVY